MAATYSKHKDRSPEETVELTASILDDIDIECEVLGLNHPFLGTYSNRIQIKGTTIGTNGKRTTEAYALASGYAELIERIRRTVGTSAVRQAEFAEARAPHAGCQMRPDESTSECDRISAYLNTAAPVLTPSTGRVPRACAMRTILKNKRA